MSFLRPAYTHFQKLLSASVLYRFTTDPLPVTTFQYQST
jgi:hypothetical protein